MTRTRPNPGQIWTVCFVRYGVKKRIDQTCDALWPQPKQPYGWRGGVNHHGEWSQIMSGSRRGADIAQLEELQRIFRQSSSELNGLTSRLNQRTVSSSEAWWGPGADRFRAAWAEAKPHFDKMVQALEMASQDVKRSQQNIEAATR